MIEFQVRKDDISKHRLVETTGANGGLADGQIEVAIKQFGLTANNITYAVVGDRIGYWSFYPPIGDDTDGWGVIPVWGFAEVIESKTDEIDVGERIFGFLPPATELTMTPGKVTESRFVETSPHRSQLVAAYNHYTRTSGDPDYDPRSDNERMLLRPLFATAFCLWDSIQDKQWYGAKQVVIVSASSKTGIGLSYAIKDDPSAPPVIGLTSKRNVEFVNGLGTYDRAVTYDQIKSIDSRIPTVIVDMSGNREVLGELHSHLGDNMKFCINVGLTHWKMTGANQGIIAQRSEFFFAPAHLQKRAADWGPEGLEKRVSDFSLAAGTKTRDWMKIKTIDGLAAVAERFEDISNGRIPAEEGLIVQL